jgi:hypothetical protein
MIEPKSSSYFEDTPSPLFGSSIQPFLDSREKKVNSVGTAILRHLPSFVEKTIEKHQIKKAVNEYLKNMNKAQKFLPQHYPELFTDNKSYQEQIKTVNKRIFLHDLQYLNPKDLLLVKSLSPDAIKANPALRDTFLEALNEKIASQQPPTVQTQTEVKKELKEEKKLDEQSLKLKEEIEKNPLLSFAAMRNLITNVRTKDAIDEWANKQYLTENLNFLRELENFKTTISKSEDSEKQQIAQQFYDRFLSKNVRSEINISGSEREEIERNIANNNITEKLFGKAEDQVYTMYTDQLRRDWGSNQPIKKSIEGQLGISD